MIAMAFIDFLRVLFAFALAFTGVPMLGQGYRLWRGEPINRLPAEWIPIVLRAFVLASFAAETLGSVLGSVRLCLSGLIFAACAVGTTYGFLKSQQVRLELKEQSEESIWQPLVTLLEPQQPPEFQSQPKAERFQRGGCFTAATMFRLLLALTAYAFARPAMHQLSFDYPASYFRTVSLAALTAGGSSWQADGSVALLAPLVSFSGLDAASVTRFAGPIFGAIFAALIAICVWQVWRTTTAAALTLGLFACVAFASSHANWELQPSLISTVYWTAAAAVLPYSWRFALLAAATGFLTAPEQWVPIVIAVLLAVGLYLGYWLRSLKGFAGSTLAATECLGTILLVLFLQHGANPDPQPSQYESAARACQRIASQFHRNDWLVVSPFQELAFTYGHGWHLELGEFVARFHRTDVSGSTFSFPYEANNVFFFVERRPLPLGSRTGNPKAIWRYSPAESSEWPTFLSCDPLGRASLEYQAAALLTAYALKHKNLSVFQQDDFLTVYRLVSRQPGGFAAHLTVHDSQFLSRQILAGPLEPELLVTN